MWFYGENEVLCTIRIGYPGQANVNFSTELQNNGFVKHPLLKRF